VVFHINAVATLVGQPPPELVKASGLRSFEIVPLETVSETAAFRVLVSFLNSHSANQYNRVGNRRQLHGIPFPLRCR
jgi:hypothetical protein